MNIISTDQFVYNTSIYFSQEGDFGVLATDTSFISCSNTNPLIAQIPASVIDTILPLVLINEPLNNTDTIFSNNQITIDSLICLLSSNIIEFNETQHLNIFPNPAESIIEVQFDGKQAYSLEEIYIELYDLKGCYLGKIRSRGNNIYDVSNIPPGFYFLKLNIGDKSYFEKLTILN